MGISSSLRMTFMAIVVAGGGIADARPAPAGAVRNIVIVHGALTDGSGWRHVYDRLTNDGYNVSIVQEPLTGLAEDIAATQWVIDRQVGPVILVGHSYGGVVITAAGADPKVRALVYVAALQPDVGETSNELDATMPPSMPGSDFKTASNGFIFIDPERFAADAAADLPPAEARFLANSQMAVSPTVFDARVTVAAWRHKPSYGIIATADHALNPKLARWMYKRSGARITEIASSHLVYLSHPAAVAAVIERAADDQHASAARVHQ